MLTQAIGKVGSGKSLWAMEQLCLELHRSTRQIVTTMDILIPELNQFVQKRWPLQDCRVCQRITFIDKAQLKQFWRHRGNERLDHVSPLVLGKFGEGDEWKNLDPVFYLLDEDHEGFGARDWQKTGPEFISYITQHRHLGDDVLGTCPQPSLLDKQFRGMIGECVVLDNWYKRSVKWFKLPRVIKWKLYANCPPMPGEMPSQDGTMRIDAAGLAGCYRTEGGLGVVGKQADKGRESKGVPWWTLIFLLVGLVVGTVYATRWVFRSAGSHATKLASFGGSSPGGSVTSAPVVPVVAPAVVVTSAPVMAPPVVVSEKKVERPVARSFSSGFTTEAGRRVREWAIVETDEERYVGKFLDVAGSVLVLDGRAFDYRPRVRSGK